MAARLSKSRFQTGLQCPKALWLTCHARELADPIGESQQAIFDTGIAVGELARERFPGGTLVAEDYTQSSQALVTTRTLFENPPYAVFEAAFEYGGVFVRPDVLVRVGADEWDLYEVKSSTRVKPEHITDVAVQAWVLAGSGLDIRRTFLTHLDNTYVYPGGDYDLNRLFADEDVTSRALGMFSDVPRLVAEMLAMLEGPEPTVPIGKRCNRPYDCAFYGHCHDFLPEHPVTKLPRISEDLLDALIAEKVFSIGDIPLDFPGLTRAQRAVCEVVQSGEPRFVGDIARSLSDLRYPTHFLDFETFSSALPLYRGTRPYQNIPFQWSDHVLGEDGNLEHRDFLYEGDEDPRPDFVSTLIDALGVTGSIVVYSGFENTRLSELSSAFPDRAAEIASIQLRLFDLLGVVRRHVEHPDCLGSSSIKVVLPALVDDLSYDGLDIAEGQTASRLYRESVTGHLNADERAKLFSDLRAYCGTDTLAMVKLLEALEATQRR